MHKDGVCNRTNQSWGWFFMCNYDFTPPMTLEPASGPIKTPMQLWLCKSNSLIWCEFLEMFMWSETQWVATFPFKELFKVSSLVGIIKKGSFFSHQGEVPKRQLGVAIPSSGSNKFRTKLKNMKVCRLFFFFNSCPKESQYTCPKCNAHYCSSACYKSQAHLRCSESFYKEQVEQQASLWYFVFLWMDF